MRYLLGARSSAAEVGALMLPLLVIWLVVLAAVGLPIARINPTPAAEASGLEQLGAVMLGLVPLPHCLVLWGDPSWLAALPSRHSGLVRVTRLAMHIAVSLVGICAVVALAHGAVVGQLFGVWLVVWALSIAGGLIRGVVASALLPALGVIALSIPRLVPWSANILYNRALSEELVLIGAISLLVAMAGCARMVHDRGGVET